MSNLGSRRPEIPLLTFADKARISRQHNIPMHYPSQSASVNSIRAD